LGVNAASRPGWGTRNTSADLFHDPFVLFGFLSSCSTRISFSTQVVIPPQGQTVLVAKQTAFLGIGIGWNEVEFVGLNEDFHNRRRRSEEQVRIKQPSRM
jgi:alkanesulfonate monooxygenase SsuD/methylene tetrahydromethanopterin reductase-like flavin-dependent oxidoreductase (luciferase family)